MSDIKPTSVPSKRLAASIDASASTIQLDNIKGWNGSDLTSSDFGTIMFAVLRNDANTLMELIELDPTTIADTAITINKRGLKFTGDLTTQVSANKLTWVKNATIVELGSNAPQLLQHFVDTISDETISGVKTFSTLPATTAGDPVADNDMARKAYVDNVVAGSFPADRLVVAGNAGETVADGNLIYFDETDNEWKLTDADTAATVEGVLLGIAQGAGTNGNAITGGVLLKGVDDAQTGMTTGDVMYASNTAGGIASSAGTTEVNVGIAKSTTELYFTPRFLHFLTEDQQDALAGNDGTPSDTNRYTTETAVQKGVTSYAADAEASDTYVITLDPVPAAYTTGMVVNFKANTANTGACTINVNSLGAKSIKKNHDQDPATGDIESGQVLTLVYDGTAFQMQSQLATSVTAYALARNTIANNSSVTTSSGAGTNTDTVVAHGLGVTPKLITITATILAAGSTNASYVVGFASYDSSGNIANSSYSGWSQSGTLSFSGWLRGTGSNMTAQGAGGNKDTITLSVLTIGSTNFTFRINGANSGTSGGTSTVTNINWTVMG